MRILMLCTALIAATVACSGDADSSAEDSGPASNASDTSNTAAVPTPPKLPDDFTWTGRYVVPDLDVEVPFTWTGRDGDFQMIAGGDGEEIHFTNVLHDGQLYTLTYEWPGLKRNPCSHVGPFTVAEFNDGLAEASFVGRETLHGDEDHVVHHYRSTAVLDLPPELVPELGDVQLRLPLMAGDIYVDVDDNTTFRQVLHFGLQNLYDPNLDEWILVDEAEPVAGEVDLPDECAAALSAADVP